MVRVVTNLNRAHDLNSDDAPNEDHHSSCSTALGVTAVASVLRFVNKRLHSDLKCYNYRMGFKSAGVI